MKILSKVQVHKGSELLTIVARAKLTSHTHDDFVCSTEVACALARARRLPFYPFIK
jgi:hypothetical protein